MVGRERAHKFVSAVVLAAGASRRLGRMKQLTRFGGQYLLERTLKTLKASKVDQIVVVIGYRAADVVKKIDLSLFTLAFNRAFTQGMSSSIKEGLAAVDERAAGALFVMADQPFLTTKMIDGIIELFQISDNLIVAPTYRGVQGNPVLISRELFSEVLTITGDVGAKSLLKRHKDRLAEYAVDRQEALLDIDVPKDLANVRGILKARRARGTGQPKKPASPKEKPGRR